VSTPETAVTDTEKLVAAVLCEALELNSVDRDEDFFELGGHSMLAVQVVYRLTEETGVELELADFFDLATVARVAEQLDRLRAEGADADGVVEGEL
jgi:acyl carrier protein